MTLLARCGLRGVRLSHVLSASSQSMATAPYGGFLSNSEYSSVPNMRHFASSSSTTINGSPVSSASTFVRPVYTAASPKSQLLLAKITEKSSGHDTEGTLAQQAHLPRYPVPPLRQTMEKYLRYLQPLVPPKDFEFAKGLVDKFLASGGEGEKLQELLLERAKNHENWLSDWWLHCAYLNVRGPVVINSNPGLQLPHQHFDSTDAWLTYSAKLVRGLLDFKYLLDHQKVPVDRVGGAPMCMSQFYSLFSSCRIPGERRDSVVRYRTDPAAQQQGKQVQHIAVAHNNHFFSVRVFHENGAPLSVTELKHALHEVVTRSAVKGQPIGLMTAENRNVWAKTYKRLSKYQKNEQSFDQIQKGLFLLCLDQPIFGELDKQGHSGCKDALSGANALHGGGHKLNSANRWFDKTLQYIVSADGACGLNYEHAPSEGPPVIALIDHALKWISKWDAENNITAQTTPHGDSNANAVGNQTGRVQELAFTLDAQAREELDMAKTNIFSLVNDVALHSLSFTHFGKDKIKAQKLSPDAFIQVAMQLAYRRLHGKPCATYESGSIRKFLYGRTDTIRSCSPETVAFTTAMLDEKCSWEKRLSLMVEAVSQHKRYTEAVMDGMGIDRHLLGLKMIAVENGLDVPKFLVDTSYSAATHWRLSTSQVPCKSDSVMCFGPVVPDGYGFCYNPQSSKIRAMISAYKSSPDTEVTHLAKHMEQALTDMYKLLTADVRRPSAKL